MRKSTESAHLGGEAWSGKDQRASSTAKPVRVAPRMLASEWRALAAESPLLPPGEPAADV